MGYTNSDLMEEIMILSFEEGIINDVREEVKKLLNNNQTLPLYEIYEMAYNKVSKKNFKNN
jgi:hypothetical protein